jgi:hypothetical protein
MDLDTEGFCGPVLFHPDPNRPSLRRFGFDLALADLCISAHGHASVGRDDCEVGHHAHHNEDHSRHANVDEGEDKDHDVRRGKDDRPDEQVGPTPLRQRPQLQDKCGGDDPPPSDAD